MDKQKYVCIDLDGTIAHYIDWQGETVFGEPVEGVQQALGRLQAEGWKIIIFTTRGNKDLIAGYLKNHKIPYDYINENPTQPDNAADGKPYAEAYIDDRGIQFNGNWPAAVNEALHFTPWEKRSEMNQGDEYRKESIAFLGRDFEEAFKQLREYDKQIWEITKFSFLQLLGSIGAVWTIFTLANGNDAPKIPDNAWQPVGAAILVISFLFSLLGVQFLLRSRVYFAVTARYINDQRKFFLSSKPIGFGNQSRYYTDPSQPKAFDAGSTQLLSTYVISLVGALVLAAGIGIFAQYIGVPTVLAVLLGLVVWLVTSLATIGYAILYLRSKRDTSASQDVFGGQAS